jgi:DNA (cytosine-5)-methyltransferase 1
MSVAGENRKFTFLEVCSGAGGLSHGFIDRGFHPVLLNEIDQVCCETLSQNHPEVEISNISMEDLDLDQYVGDKVDVLMGGVPCQSFSQAGNRKGLNDNRGNLLLCFIKMLSVIQPKVWLIENVKGLSTHNGGATLKYILQQIETLGRYRVSYRVLNANDYGVPQKRERIFLVGIRDDITRTYEFPTPHSYKPLLGDVLIDCPESEGHRYNPRLERIMEQVPSGGCWVDLPEEEQKAYLGNSYYSGGGRRGIARRLSLDAPSLTLLTSPSQKQTERCHPTETRPLQIVEYARIQTFPDSYKFSGSLTQRYRQIGNAVPVKLAQAMAESILRVLQ